MGLLPHDADVRGRCSCCCLTVSRPGVLTPRRSLHVRSYTKPKGQIPDYNAPVVLHSQRPTMKDFCDRLHKAIAKQFK